MAAVIKNTKDSKSKKYQKNQKKGGNNFFSFFSTMDENAKKGWLKALGVALAFFAAFTLISVVSYMFTWQADQSLLSNPDMMNQAEEVSNYGGKLGYRWGKYLFSDIFGLGSLAIVIMLSAIAYRVFYINKSFGLFRIIIMTFLAAIITSLISAYLAIHIGDNLAFNGGWGGELGSSIIIFFQNLVGSISTFFILVCFTVVWLILASNRFILWMSNFGESKSGSSDKNNDSEISNDVEATDDIADANDYYDDAHADAYDTYDDTAADDDTDTYDDTDVDDFVDDIDEVNTDDDYSGYEVPDEDVITIPENDTPSYEKSNEPSVDLSVQVSNLDNLSSDVEEELPNFNSRDDLNLFEFPSLDLLHDYQDKIHHVSQDELNTNSARIKAALLTFRIQVVRVHAIVGPTITLYKLFCADGVTIAQIKAREDDIAMALRSKKGVRVVRLEDAVGIEVANSISSVVPLKALLNNDSFRDSQAELPIAIGYTITQSVKVFDLADAPHLLIAGATKQGKSVGLNVIISSLLYSKHPSELKFVFIDPKMVEFTTYKKLLNHYLAVLPTAASEEEEKENAIVKQAKQAEEILRSLCIEMDERYMLLSKASTNNLKSYNEKYNKRHLLPTEGHKFMPYLVVVIDEYADLTMSGGISSDAKANARSITSSIIRLAQKGRAAGIHVVIATQRPSVDVITGLIKTNFPTRIAFRTVSRTDSSTILDSPGAEKLIGKGDMLYYAGIEMERIQCALVDMPEISDITKFIASQQGYMKSYNTPYYLPSIEEETSGPIVDMSDIDPSFEDAANIVVTSQHGSTSALQRKLGMGYARAGRVMDQLEAAGIVGPQNGSKTREILVSDLSELSLIIKAFLKDETN